jgi:hypothetical protein
MGAEPPLKGPVIAIFTESAADAWLAKRPASNINNVFFISLPPVVVHSPPCQDRVKK